MEPAKPFRVWPYLVINLVTACWLDFTSFHRLLTSDSVLFVLASLYEMRVFFWEQDRVGMLIPLLASPCESPFHNLLLQSGAMIFLGLTMPVMVARVLTPHRIAPLAITVANAALLLWAPDKIHENWLLVCNYPSAIVLGLFGIALVDTRPAGESWTRRSLRVIGCGFFLVVAHWQYVGAVLFLGPLVVFRAWAKTGPGAPMRRHGWWRTLARPLFDPRSLSAAPLVWLALGIILLVMMLVRESNLSITGTPSEGLPPEEWPDTWWKLIGATAELPRMDEYAIGLGTLCGIGFVAALLFERRVLGQIVRAVIPLLLTAALEIAILGTREWTVHNLYHPRYLLAATTAVTTSVALVGLVPLLSRIPRRRETSAILFAGLLLLAGATGRYGWPSPAGVRAIVHEKCGAMTPVLLDSKCEAVGGDFWVVWIAMFHADMVLYERGDPRVIFGLGYRSQPMQHRWEHLPDGFRIALPEDEYMHVAIEAEKRGLVPLERLGNSEILLFPAHPHAEPRRMRVGIYRTRVRRE